MGNYKPNSHKSRNDNTPEKKVEKIVSGSVKTKKKNEVQKFADVFLSEDVHNVKSYILLDVLVPAIKKAISDIVTSGIDMILYGGSGHKKNTTSSSRVSYNKKYSDDRNDYRSNGTYRTRVGYEYDDIILDNRGEAEDVLIRMDELVSTYGLVSVADFFDLLGVTGNYTDNNYGWTDIRNAKVMRVKDGYMIKLPKALPLN